MKPIVDFPGYYAGQDGNIYSYFEKTRNSRLSFHRPPHILKPFLHRTGYLYVVLVNSKKRLTVPVHKLVCTAFHGPCPLGYETSHRNGNRLDNVPTNLLWETKKENNAHRKEHGTNQQGVTNSRAKINKEQLDKVRQLLKTGRTQQDIARIMGLTQPFISDIKTGRRYAQS